MAQIFTRNEAPPSRPDDGAPREPVAQDERERPPWRRHALVEAVSVLPGSGGAAWIVAIDAVDAIEAIDAVERIDAIDETHETDAIDVIDETDEIGENGTRGQGGAPTWALVQAPGGSATIDGVRIGTGIAVLEHGACLQAGPGAPPAWFSTESPPRRGVHPGPDDTPCARCRGPITPGAAAVRCPRCRLWHHTGTRGRDCWTYAAVCAGCPQPTGLDQPLRWRPGDGPLDG